MRKPLSFDFRSPLAAVILCCLPGIGSAQVIVFDTTPLAGDAQLSVNTGSFLWAQRITVSGVNTTIVSASITVANIPGSPWSAALRLYPDNGGTPLTAGDIPNVGGYLGDVGTITGFSGSGTASFVVTPTTLPAGTYWLSIEGTANNANIVANTSSSGGTGAWLTSNDYQIASWSGSFNGLPGYTLDMTVTAIPEPSTYAAILGGLALAGAMIRRRRPAAPVTSAG